MRTLLVAGAFHVVLCQCGLDIVNRESMTLNEVLQFLQQDRPLYDQIVITDDGLLKNDIYSIRAIIKDLRILQEQENTKQPLLLITNNVLLSEITIPGLDIDCYFADRIAISHYLKASSRYSQKNSAKPLISRGGMLDPQLAEKPQSLAAKEPSGAKTKGNRLIKLLKKDKSTTSPSSAYAEREFAAISSEISRVIAITGCRGSGVTSTAVNLAHIASNKGLSTMLVDLDIANCTLNLYFNGYYETAEKEPDIANSLIRNLAKPQNYKLNSYNIDNLFITTLSYSFNDKALLGRFYTAAKLINMLTVFRKHFQLCVLDMPFEVLGKFAESILYIDDFGLCVPNNLYALTGALRGLQSLFGKEVQESLLSKSKIIVSKYNGHSTLQEQAFTPELVCELLAELSDIDYEKEFELAGHIPYDLHFDMQLELDLPISSSNSHIEKAYTDILLRMIKGVR